MIVNYHEGVTHHLVGLTEIAEMLGVSRQYTDRLVRQDGFPAPEAVITAGRIWSRDAIEKWAKATGRTIVEEGS
jgi:predicted DNA-binding transcriptional regulator AlpA